MVYQDNTSTISLVTKRGGKPRTKYMKVHQEVVKEKVGKGDIRIEYIKTSMMFADILTEPMNGVKLHNFVRALLNHLVPISGQQGCIEQNNIRRK